MKTFFLNFINVKTEINFSLADRLLDAESANQTDLLSGVVVFSDILRLRHGDFFFFLKISDVNTLASNLDKAFHGGLGWFPRGSGEVPGGCNSFSL